MKAFAYGIALAGLVLARSATADASLDRVRACMPQQNDAARLACYDRELGRTTAAPPVPTTAATPIAPAKSATAATPIVPATPAVPASAPVRTTANVPPIAAGPVTAAIPSTAGVPASPAIPSTPGKSADFGMTPELRHQQEVRSGIKPPPPPAESLSAKVAKIGTYGNGLLVVTLDNGQVWEQQESGDAQLAVGEAVKISRGMFGALWMDDASHRRTRVKRIQ